MFHRQSSTAAIESHLRAIESELAQMGRSAGRQAAEGAANVGDQVGGAIVGVLNELADRYRTGWLAAGDGAQRLGNEAVKAGRKIGHDALDQVASGVGRRPLVTLAIAVGLGILIGSAGRWR
jgi:hypothetical protein